MSKLKATKSGKAGKHKGQDTFATVYARSLRKGRVMTGTDQRLLGFILRGLNDEQEGALAGAPKSRGAKKSRIVIGGVAPAAPKPPMLMAAG